MAQAAAECDVVATTLFVNPLQFAPSEDLDAYPRDAEGDVAKADGAGVAYLFAPDQSEMFPEPSLTSVRVAGLSEVLDGEHRPGHFDGVATIVTKLFGLAGPCRAYFGEKDFQQLTLIRRMVADLDMPVEVVGVPIQRDAGGLALSSRNRYLAEDQHETALTLSRALAAGAAAAPLGREAVLQAAGDTLLAEPGLTLDRLDLVDPITLTDAASGEARLLVAAILAGKSGPIRLIDNTALTLGMA
jgi:pantoate--beta-alanine ligase